jgi:hypothetical protein
MGMASGATGRYQKANITRNGVNHSFMANGWGPGFKSHTISWNGTSFVIIDMEGSQGMNYEPASYPAMYCGLYSMTPSQSCGLPAAIDSLKSVKTGWRWNANGNKAEYNAAYDIWVGDNNALKGYLMVWLREPPGQQPAGMPTTKGVTVANVPGTWDLWVGKVGNFPIVNWVKPEGQDISELEFDVLDFVKDAKQRNIMVPGSQLLAVAAGFEIWNGPIKDLKSEDFYVDVK